MTTAYIEPGDDLILSPSGGVQLAVGWDEVRQRILRRLITNPVSKMSDGTPVAPDYLFDAKYGDGLQRKVGGSYTQVDLNIIKNLIINGILSDSSVDKNFIPTVQFISAGEHVMYVVANLKLVSGQPGQIAITLNNLGVTGE